VYGLIKIKLIGLGTSYKPMKLRVVSKVHGIVSSSLSLLSCFWGTRYM